MEIFVDRDGEVILKKYSPIGELGDFAQEYADSLFETTEHIALITDRDAVVAVAGGPKKQWMDKRVPALVERLMEERRSVVMPNPGDPPYALDEDDDEVWAFEAQAIAPIIAEGDPIGAVILASTDASTKMGELELKLAETAAGFLAKQMEE